MKEITGMGFRFWEARPSTIDSCAWTPITETSMPELDRIVWLWDGEKIWIGGRANDSEGWLWGNSYGQVWYSRGKWNGDLTTDDDYQPTHWAPLPEPPT